MNTPLKRLLITPGEPAGIGPDILIQTAATAVAAELVAVADPDVLLKRAKRLNIPLRLTELDIEASPTPHVSQHLKILPVRLKGDVIPGQLNPAHAPYVLNTLTLAVDTCLLGKAHGLTTGPVQKSVMNAAGIPFTGHTEFLAERTGSKKVLMLFVVDTLRVALMTVHLPLKAVPAAITAENLAATLQLLDTELKKLFNIPQPKILVAGLNPHAGESGYLGREEIDIMQPVIHRLQKAGLSIAGPYPADTIFNEPIRQTGDVILAMYHDQGLPIVKHVGFYTAVNVTLGLPIIRTSVDHGTALEIAGTGKAHPGSLQHAIQLALKLETPSSIHLG